MRFILKCLAVSSASVVAVSCFFTRVSAESIKIKEDIIMPEIKKRLSMPHDAGISYALPDFMKTLGQEITDFSDLAPYAGYTAITSDISIYNEELPETFDMRLEGTVSSVKNQGSYGTCWAFSACASAETSIMKYHPSIDLSEWHTAYYPYYWRDKLEPSIVDPVDVMYSGGTCFHVANLWSQWIGPVSESKFLYGDETFLNDADEVERYSTASDYHLENAFLFDYSSDGRNRENINTLVKEFVYNGNAVDVSYSTSGYSYVYNTANSSDKPRDANHSVIITGWDDNFPATEFKYGNRPSENGAWLARNSWDTGFGDNGYFWISYEDTSLCEFAVYELGDNDNYTTNYQYDLCIPASTMSADDDPEINKPSYMANIFTAEKTEQIEAVSTYINNPGTEYEIIIYTDLKDESIPSSGTPSEATYGKSDLTGYITIELDEDVIVEEGELFAVSVKMYCEENKFVLPTEMFLCIQNYEDGSITALNDTFTNEKICTFNKENESFYSEDGQEWIDVFDNNYVYPDEDKNQLCENIISEYGDELDEEIIEGYRELFDSGDLIAVTGSMALKAFANPVNTVYFSHISGNVPSNEAVSLSVKNGSDIYYSINDSSEILYTEPIIINEKSEISATTDHISFTTREYTPAKAEFSALGYYTSDSAANRNDIFYAERSDESTYDIVISEEESEIRFFLVSASEVYMDGELMLKNMYTESFDIDKNVSEFKFNLVQDNRIANTVTVNINRYGDANKDGMITPIDASIVLAYYALENTVGAESLSDTDMKIYDYNNDKLITPIDAAEILRAYAKSATTIH